VIHARRKVELAIGKGHVMIEHVCGTLKPALSIDLELDFQHAGRSMSSRRGSPSARPPRRTVMNRMPVTALVGVAVLATGCSDTSTCAVAKTRSTADRDHPSEQAARFRGR
jgi:hypothetical protein